HVVAAITALKERGGSSMKKQSVFIKKALKSGVEKGTLVQVKGKGASGSFKLGKKPAAGRTDA
uniref:Histone H1.2, embryonic (Fragments) n=1 Tax=Parechinus angulosus TaxID=7658 RepID=H12E_PARAN|nr:RecName: Full=Histone H1.2, embryonic [Parechinus angulosus]